MVSTIAIWYSLLIMFVDSEELQVFLNILLNTIHSFAHRPIVQSIAM